MREPRTLEKFPDEERVFSFDFSKQPDVGTDIQTPAINISPTTQPALEAGTPSIVGAQVKAEFTGGEAGKTYLVECVVNTSTGAKVAIYGKLEIVDPTEWK